VLALAVWLKCFGRLGYFPALETVPAAVVDHVRRDLRLPEEVAAVHAAARTAERHRNLIRRRFGVVLDSSGTRKVAAWKDLNFYRPAAGARYRHIDALFGEPGRNVIDWDLIEGHYVGRVIRTIALLRFLSDAQLRTRTTAATNKVESYNHFVSWCRFGNRGIIADNDPDEQEKVIKFATLLANCVIFHTVVDMTAVIRDLTAEGWAITAEDLAVLSPYLTAHIQRFGVYSTDEVTLAPCAYDAHLDVALDLPATG
jgi:hypothetical protein